MKNLPNAVASSDLSIPIYLMFISSGKDITKFGNFSSKHWIQAHNLHGTNKSKLPVSVSKELLLVHTLL